MIPAQLQSTLLMSISWYQSKLYLELNWLETCLPLVVDVVVGWYLRFLKARRINAISSASKLLKHSFATINASWISRLVVLCAIDQTWRSSRTRFVHRSMPWASANSGYRSYSPVFSRLSKETIQDRLIWFSDHWERYSPLWYLSSLRRKRKNFCVSPPNCSVVLRYAWRNHMSRANCPRGNLLVSTAQILMSAGWQPNVWRLQIAYWIGNSRELVQDIKLSEPCPS